MEGRPAEAEALAQRFAGLFPGRFYIELQRHDTQPEILAEGPLVDIAYKLDLPLVATNQCYFGTESMYEAHDALLCIAAGRSLPRTSGRARPRHRFKSSER